MVLLKSVVMSLDPGTFIKSTFHYGSIKIWGGGRTEEDVLASTFHYGSIKIRAYKTLYIMLFIASYFVDLK